MSQTTNMIFTVLGATETLTVAASGTALQYQWQFEGTNLVGATNASLTLTNITSAMDGNYYATISNLLGGVVSQPIALSVCLAVRQLPTGYWPGIGYWPNVPMTYTINAAPPAGTPNYSVQDQIEGLNTANAYYVTNVSLGHWDYVNSDVKFGPFFNGNSHTLTYQLVPGPNCTNTIVLNGTNSINGTNNTVVAGPNEINLLPLHPADNGATNGDLAIDGIIGNYELFNYVAAWNDQPGSYWPVNPTPIPQDYVTSAVGIWQNGGSYIYNPSLGAYRQPVGLARGRCRELSCRQWSQT